jgi:hypothetical protein
VLQYTLVATYQTARCYSPEYRSLYTKVTRYSVKCQWRSECKDSRGKMRVSEWGYTELEDNYWPTIHENGGMLIPPHFLLCLNRSVTIVTAFVAWADKVVINAVRFPSNTCMSTNKLHSKGLWDVIICPWVISYKSSRRHIPKDLNLHRHRKSAVIIPALKMEYQTVLGMLLMCEAMYA